MTKKKEPKYHSQLVGRAQELAKLKEQFENSMEGSRKLVLIEGEVGIGKTRLIEELYPQMEELRFEIISVRCQKQKVNDPYGIFFDIIDKKVSTGKDSKSKTPILEFLETGKLKEEGGLRPDLLRHQSRMFELVSQFLIQTARESPICIVFDDLHNADVQSLKLLHYVVKSLSGSKIFICGTYRVEEIETEMIHPLRELIQRMSREKLVDIITLDRFTKDEGTKMITHMFPENLFSDDFMGKVYVESEGNPLFIIELLKTMAEEGAIYKENGRWQVAKKYELLEIPKTIRDVISRRILRLSSESINALRWASVIGDEFSFDLLKHVLNTSDEELINVMDELLNDRLIAEDSDVDLYRFAHTKIREIAYETFTRGKEDMHHKIALIMERLMPPHMTNGIYDLVYHLTFTKDYQRIAQYNMKAGKKAMSSYALKEAYTYFSRAIDALAHFGDEEGTMKRKLDIIINLGDINVGLGQMEKALWYYNEAIRKSNELKDDSKIVESYMKISSAYIRKGEFDVASMKLMKCKELAEKIHDHHWLVWIHSNLGMIKERRGNHEEAIEEYITSLKYARLTNNYSDMGIANMRLGSGYRAQTELDTAARYVRKAINIWEKINDFRIPYAYGELANIYLQLGEPDEAIQYFEKCIEFSRKTGDIYLKGASLSGLADAYMDKRDFERPLEYLIEAQEIFERLDVKDMTPSVYKKLGIIYKTRKEWKKSKEYFEKSVTMLNKLNLPLYLGESYFEYGLMHKELGNMNKCRTYLEKALEIFRKLKNDIWIKRARIELDTVE